MVDSSYMLLHLEEIDTEAYFQRIKAKLNILKRKRHSMLDQWINQKFRNGNSEPALFEVRLFYNSILSKYYRDLRDSFLDDGCTPFFQYQNYLLARVESN